MFWGICCRLEEHSHFVFIYFYLGIGTALIMVPFTLVWSKQADVWSRCTILTNNKYVSVQCS